VVPLTCKKSNPMFKQQLVQKLWHCRNIPRVAGFWPLSDLENLMAGSNAI
jgi:hypothetical protein